MITINLMNSVYDFWAYSGTDQRVRIVGARAILRGISPYTLDYSPELPVVLQDPDQYVKGLSRCPYPPSLLLFWTPLSSLSYRLQRGIWMALEWIALLATIALLARTLRHESLRSIFVIIAIIGFAGSHFWRLHVERGQYHVFVTFLLAWGSYDAIKIRRDRWKTGIPFGLALSVRPTIAVVLLFFLLFKHYRTAAFTLITALFIFLISLTFGGLRFWEDWQVLVNRYEDLVAGVSQKSLQPIHNRLPAEGFQPGKMLHSRTSNNSALSILNRIQKKSGISLGAQNSKLLAKGIVAVATLFFLLIFVWAHLRRKFGFRFGLGYAVYLSVMLEFIAPIRFGYADTQFLLLLALSLPLLLRKRGLLPAAILLLALVYPVWSFTSPRTVDTSRTLLLFMVTTLIFVGSAAYRIVALNSGRR